MKKYEKPQIATEKLEVRNIIAASNIFEGLADLDKMDAGDFEYLVQKQQEKDGEW